MPAKKKSSSVPSTPSSERASKPMASPELSAGVREHLERSHLAKKNAARVREVNVAINLAYRALWRSTRHEFPSEFQSSTSGENKDQSAAPIDPTEYASRWVQAMEEGARALRALENAVGTSLEPLVHSRVSEHFASSLRTNAGAVQDCFVRVYLGKNDSGERGAISRDLAAILADDIQSLPQFHAWFEHAANTLRHLWKRIRASWDGNKPTDLEQGVDAFLRELAGEAGRVTKRTAKKRGRPRVGEAERQLDRQIYAAWKTRQYSGRAALGRGFGVSAERVTLAIDRLRRQEEREVFKARD